MAESEKPRESRKKYKTKTNMKDLNLTLNLLEGKYGKVNDVFGFVKANYSPCDRCTGAMFGDDRCDGCKGGMYG